MYTTFLGVPGHDLALYVMTRRHLKKARNIAQSPRVALVVPLPRRFLQFVPPATIQLRGRAYRDQHRGSEDRWLVSRSAWNLPGMIQTKRHCATLAAIAAYVPSPPQLLPIRSGSNS
jgi:hypothetical protein